MGPYAPWEDDLLREYVRGKFAMREMQDKLHGRSADSIRDRVTRLGLLRNYDGKPDWEWAPNTNLFTIEDQSAPEQCSG
jgi:hypothetical protein